MLKDYKQLPMNMYRHFMHDSLYRNSIYILLNMLIASAAGFLFWAINTRLFSPDQIGTATALISSVILLASLSLLGLNNSVIRYYKELKSPNRFMSATLIAVLLATILTSAIFINSIEFFAPDLKNTLTNPAWAISFVVLVYIVAVNAFTDNVFIAKRVAFWILIESVLMGLTKIILPFTLSSSNFVTIIFVYACSYIAALLVTTAGFKLNNISVFAKPDFTSLKRVSKYSFGNYISGIASSGANMFIPLVAFSLIGSTQSAFFFIALSVASIIFMIPSSINKSLFAEGSHNITEIRQHQSKSLKLITALLTTSILLLIIIGRPILSVFGSIYSETSYIPMLILAVSSIPIAIISTVGTMLNIVKLIEAMVVMNFIILGAVMSFVYIMNDGKPTSLALGWLSGQSLGAGIAVIFYFKYLHQKVLK